MSLGIIIHCGGTVDTLKLQEKEFNIYPYDYSWIIFYKL